MTRTADKRGGVLRRSVAVLAAAALTMTVAAGPARAATGAAHPGVTGGTGAAPSLAQASATPHAAHHLSGPTPSPAPPMPAPLDTSGPAQVQAAAQQYQADVQKDQQKADALQNEKGTLEQRAGDIQTREDSLASQAADLKAQADALKSQADALNDAIAAHNAEPHTFTLPDEEAAYAAYNAEKERLDAQKADLQSKSTALNGKATKLQGDQEKADADQTQLEADVQKHNDAVSALENDISQLEDERQQVLAKIADLLENLEEAQSGETAAPGGDEDQPQALTAPPAQTQAAPTGGDTPAPSAPSYEPVGTPQTSPSGGAAPGPAGAAAPPPVLPAPVTATLDPETVSGLPASKAADLNPRQGFNGLIPEANGDYAAAQVQPPPGASLTPGQKAFADAVNNGGKATARVGGGKVTIDHVVPVAQAPAADQGGDIPRPTRAAPPKASTPNWLPPSAPATANAPPVSISDLPSLLDQHGFGDQAKDFDLEYAPVITDAQGAPAYGSAPTDALGNPVRGPTGKPVIQFSDLGLQNPGKALDTFYRQAVDEELAAGAGAGPCPEHSFAGATKVLMADGSAKAIQDVRAGDLIENATPGGGTETHRVERVHVTTTDTDFVDVVVGGAGTHGGTVTGTADHPYYDHTAGAFVDAGRLPAGDRLQTGADTTATVEAVHPHGGPLVTYDLTVEGLHTYFVIAGDTPVLVHNCGDPEAVAALTKARVDELHDKLAQGARGRRSTAIIQARDQNGKTVSVVGWSGDRTLDRRIRDALGPDEIPADRMAGDAEATALDYIKRQGWTPIAGAANRPVCPWCQNALFDDFSASIGPARMVGPWSATRIGNSMRTAPDGTQLMGRSQFVWD
ncbi:polymorphic toxin-type HINT domain-containing protein [Catenulispora subtropica]|uniref:Hedgehog/intein hint domain protein n=1 Tax=Catenulispora subtropica TaxID=450798 RepID=A0ABN2T079_9ACTN